MGMIPANMADLAYRDGELFFDGISLKSIAELYGTPLFVYSETHFRSALRAYLEPVEKRDHIVAYSVKSNSNGELLSMVAHEGAGADIVSGGELFRALQSGINPSKIVFSGVGKTRKEIAEALDADILLFSVESEEELRQISEISSARKREARISLRVNPDVDPGTHPYISTGLKENKFGVDHRVTVDLYRKALELPGIQPMGIGYHIGSQLTKIGAYGEALDRLEKLVHDVQEIGVSLRYLDVGGGLGIRYYDEEVVQIREFVRTILDHPLLEKITVIFEPGRSISGNAGVFLTEILYTKTNEEKRFYICDGAMNDLIRPSLYNAYHHVLPVHEFPPEDYGKADLVGPICETGDFLAKDRSLPPFKQGDIAALLSSGAYGFVMSSNYNSRPRAAEVLIESGGQTRLIRARETYEDMIAREIPKSN